MRIDHLTVLYSQRAIQWKTRLPIGPCYDGWFNMLARKFNEWIHFISIQHCCYVHYTRDQNNPKCPSKTPTGSILVQSSHWFSLKFKENQYKSTRIEPATSRSSRMVRVQQPLQQHDNTPWQIYNEWNENEREKNCLCIVVQWITRFNGIVVVRICLRCVFQFMLILIGCYEAELYCEK